MYKNFIQNIGLKQHITAVHEERDSIMINVAKNLHYLKVYIEIVHKKKLWIQLWSLWQKFHQSFHESDKTLDWNYKLQLFMKMKRFNFDQCGKNFARGCNLNDHEIDSWIELWKSPFLDLKFKKGHIQIVHEGVLIFPK